MREPPASILEHVPLADHSTLGVGGPARYFLAAQTLAEATEALAWARESELPVTLLGGGSNVVIADAGLPGLVLQLADGQCELLDATEDLVRIRAGAGMPWDALVSRAVARGFGGIECMSGIPGMVGAAPIQNIGAYGQEVAEVIEAVEVLDMQTGIVFWLSAAECGFAYRDSVFKRQPHQHLVCSLRLRLRPNAQPDVRYAQVAHALAGEPLPDGAAGLTRVRDVVLRLRRDKAMVVDPEEPDSRSVGSFFTNPVVPVQVAVDAADRLRHSLRPGETMPSWPAPGGITLSAAWLIEHAGMPKGYGEGPVGLSNKHTLALVNRGGAKASDVLDFADHVTQRVLDASGVRLQREPVLLGF